MVNATERDASEGDVCGGELRTLEMLYEARFNWRPIRKPIGFVIQVDYKPLS